MKFPRRSGLLLHPTSLPGSFGIGDFGPQAYKFVDQLVRAGQTYWQVLPLGPTGYGDSPYQCFSAFAGNPLLISQERLVDDGLVTGSDLDDRPAVASDKVDYSAVNAWKTRLLAKAFKTFNESADTELRTEFETFCQSNQDWLDDYALFRAMKSTQSQRPWFEWPDRLKLRDERTIETARQQLEPEADGVKFSQFLFFRQWLELKKYANDSGIKIIGDIPIFVALDSSDVWINRDEFKLNEDGSARVVAGVPPDYFSKTGQLWGNPIYDWDVMRSSGFSWWISRFRSMFKLVDVARVDHFRGFVAAWEVPGKDETAENGEWVDVPGRDLFIAVRSELGELPLIAEDLGVITPEVRGLRDAFGFPGMRILQYAFGGDAKNIDLPHNYVQDTVAYTGTHDNETTAGWWSSQGGGSDPDEPQISRVQEHCLRYLDTDGSEINWDLIRAAWASVADTSIVPVQDLLGLGNEARMNMPASATGNWTWRLTEGQITDEIIDRLRDLTLLYGRNPDVRE